MAEKTVNHVILEADYEPAQSARERFTATYRWPIPRAGAAIQIGHVHAALDAMLGESVPPHAQFQLGPDGGYVVVVARWEQEYPDGR